MLKVTTYRTIILPFVLYGCGTWSLYFVEGTQITIFGNKALRKILERIKLMGNLR